MGEHRLLNCKFVNAGSFKVNISNKAKLLYLFMFTNADDRGFVDNTNDLINALENSEKEFNNNVSLELLENTYASGLGELIDKGYVYEFVDNHNNKIHLIRHWFLHNKYKSGLWTNYKKLFNEVYLEDNEYVKGKKPLKENNIKQSNVKQDNVKQDNVNNGKDTTDLDSVDIKKRDDGLEPDDYPFDI